MNSRFATFLTMTIVLATPAATRAQVTYNSVTLTWTTPGDDSLTGNAAQFDLRYSTSPLTAANFSTASRFSATPTPAAPGTRQSVTVTGLSPSTTYYFAIKTGDDVPNWSGISNVISRTTQAAPDNSRPAKLAINVSSLTDSTATLAWAAVGDDSLTGTASVYDVRYSTSPITTSNWASASQVTGEPAPAASGASESFTVRGLSRQATYYFAVRVSDEAGNISALSNVPSAITPDTARPAAITDLTSSFFWLGWRSVSAIRPRAMESAGL